MLHKKTVEISNKIITKEDIQKLASLINGIFKEIEDVSRSIAKEEAKRDAKKYEHISAESLFDTYYKKPYKRIELNWGDGIVTTFEDLQPLIDGEIFDRKQLNKLIINLEDRHQSKSINIVLTHSQNSRMNELEVEGDNEMFVYGTIEKLNEYVDSWEDQNILICIQKYRPYLSFLSALIFGYLIIELFVFIGLFNYDTLYELLEIPALGIIIIVGFLYIPLGLSTVDLLKSLWYKIEIQTGPGHKQFQKRRRNKLWFLFTLVILPFLISIISKFL